MRSLKESRALEYSGNNSFEQNEINWKFGSIHFKDRKVLLWITLVLTTYARTYKSSLREVILH